MEDSAMLLLHELLLHDWLFVLEFGLIFLLLPSTAFYITLLVMAVVFDDYLSRTLLIILGSHGYLVTVSLLLFLAVSLHSNLYYLAGWLAMLLGLSCYHLWLVSRWGYLPLGGAR